MLQTQEQKDFLKSLKKKASELTNEEKTAFDKLGEITPISNGNGKNEDDGELKNDTVFTKIEIESFEPLPRESFNNSFKVIINKMNLIEGESLPLILIGISQINKDVLNPKTGKVLHPKGGIKLLFSNPLKGLPIEKVYSSKGSLLPFEGAVIGDKINFIVTHYKFETKDQGKTLETLEGLTLSHPESITLEEQNFLKAKSIAARAAMINQLDANTDKDKNLTVAPF